MPEGLEGVKIVYEAIYKVESGYLLLSIFSFMLTLAVLGCSIICIIKKDFNSLVVFLLIAPTLFVLGFTFNRKDTKNTEYYQEYKIVAEREDYFIDPYKWKVIRTEGEIITVRSKESYKSTELNKLKGDIY